MKKISAVKNIIIHCSATDADWSVTDCKRLHTETNGWADIGYHYWIRSSGLIQVGRDEQYRGAHCRARGRNYDSIGICLNGLTVFYAHQFKALKGLLDDLKKRYGMVGIYGHSFFEGKKDCPVFGNDDYEKVTGERLFTEDGPSHGRKYEIKS